MIFVGTQHISQISFHYISSLCVDDYDGNQEQLTSDLQNFWTILTCSLWVRPDATIDISFLLVTTGLAALSFPAALCRTDVGKHELLVDLHSWVQLLSALGAATERVVTSALGGLRSLTEEQDFLGLLVTSPETFGKTDALLSLVPEFCSSAFPERKEITPWINFILFVVTVEHWCCTC